MAALVLVFILAAVLTGSVVYSLLVVVAARRWLAVRPPPLTAPVPISVLKPLAGVEEGLEENLRSFFAQQYPEFEILFAVRDVQDPAVAVVERLQREFPRVPVQLLATGEPPCPNAKVFALERMTTAARSDLLVMSDSDIRAAPDLLARVAAEFQDPRLGVSTCPYRAVPGPSFWSTLEAVGMNTEFLAGILVARLVEGMKFAVGPTIVARKALIGQIGGFARLGEYLAEDFVLGKWAAAGGFGVALSSCVVEHRIGAQGFAVNARHRLRWARSTRRSRPAGYWGQVFTNPLPPALLLVLIQPTWWPLAAVACFARVAAAWAVAGRVLRDPLCARRWWLIPMQDVVSFITWIAGFFGNTITWRGRRYYLHADGRFELTSSR